VSIVAEVQRVTVEVKPAGGKSVHAPLPVARREVLKRLFCYRRAETMGNKRDIHHRIVFASRDNIGGQRERNVILDDIAQHRAGHPEEDIHQVCPDEGVLLGETRIAEPANRLLHLRLLIGCCRVDQLLGMGPPARHQVGKAIAVGNRLQIDGVPD
jgi:hypothetical protein